MRRVIPTLISTWFCIAATSSSAALVIYSYTGRTALGDSSITAWFQFDSSAMSDGLVFFYEIPQHSFQISGNNLPMNGEYDRFLGGAIFFASAMPGPQNLPTSQSLVIQDSQSGYYVQSDFSADADVFLGGPSGLGTVYSGSWSYGLIPEPSSVGLMVLGLGLGSFFIRSRGGANKALHRMAAQVGCLSIREAVRGRHR
jgi:hypothetical protein